MNGVKTFVFFVEPSSYTLDLIEHVHKPMGIDYAFFSDAPLIAHSKKSPDAPIMGNMTKRQRVAFVAKCRKKYDLIVCNGYANLEFLSLFIGNLLTKKNFLAIESDTQPKKDRGLKGAVKRFVLQTIFKESHLLGFAGGTHEHKRYFREYGMAEERIFLMPMMVNNQKFSTTRPKPDSPFTFLYVGRIIPHKNVQTLIESFQKAFSDRSDVLLRIVGRGESLASLQSRYSDVPNIRFEGAKFGRDLVETYHTSHVLVIPSLYEPWGLVVNEAMAAGLPVLASDRVGAVGDLVRDGETGFVFDPENIDELSRLMQKIRSDRTLYETLASRAEKLMIEEWNYDLYRAGLLEALAFIRQQKERQTP